VEICGDVQEARWSSITKITLGGEMGLYQPKHPTTLGPQFKVTASAGTPNPAQCLPEGLLEPGRDSKANTEENEATAPTHYCLLAAGRIVFLMSLYYAKLNKMPLIVLDCKGIPATRRERIETAVEAGGRHVNEQYEGWIAADPFRGGVRVVITGAAGRDRSQASVSAGFARFLRPDKTGGVWLS
jgi:hypothetical protein